MPPVLHGQAEARGHRRPGRPLPPPLRPDRSAGLLNRSDLEAWLAEYGRAWEAKDPEAASALFTDDATYRETPFDEVMTGREAIRAYWRAEVVEAQDDISFGSEILHLAVDRAFVHWWSSYVRVRDGRRFRLDGAFDLEFDPATGLCRTLREWWHADQPF